MQIFFKMEQTPLVQIEDVVELLLQPGANVYVTDNVNK